MSRWLPGSVSLPATSDTRAASGPLLTLLGTKEELIGGAALYLRIYFLGMPAMALYNFGNAVFSAIGNTKKPLLYLSAAGVLNILLNLFFVVVCRLGVAMACSTLKPLSLICS